VTVGTACCVVITWNSVHVIPLLGFFLDKFIYHRSLPPVFESWLGHYWRLFRLSLRLITFRGRKSSIIIYKFIWKQTDMGWSQFRNWNWWSIQELELMVNSNFGIDLYLKKIELGLINFELKFPIKKLHPQIKAPSIILI